MPAGRKVRTGCARCKAKRLKCDETRPGCQRCTRLNEICPGYKLSLRWSTKHEISRLESAHESTRRGSHNDFVPECSPRHGDTTNTQSLLASAVTKLPVKGCSDTFNPPSPGFWTSSLDSMLMPETLGDNVTRNTLIDFDLLDDRFPLFGDLNDDTAEPTSLEIENTAMPITPGYNSLEIPSSRASTASRQMPDVIWPMVVRSEDVLIEYYFKEVAIIYSCYDGDMNPFRSIVASLWTSSELMMKTLQSMAAACLAPEYPHLSREGSKLRNEVLADLEKISASREPVDVVLLVTIMLGQTAGWHDPKDLGLGCYSSSKTLLTILESDTADMYGTLLGRNIPFFRNAIEYWEMLLAFVSSTQGLSLSAVYPRPDRMSSSLVEPHPWALVVPGMLQIIRQVGELVWKNRAASKGRRFWKASDLSNLQAAINGGSNLERQLLDYNLPSEGDIMDPRDETTPVIHLLTICQAYRLVGLIQIYRVFPDVLTARMQSQEKWEFFADCGSHCVPPAKMIAEQDRDIWLTELAMHTLKLIKSIPLESHTRCIQPFLLIALSCETGSITMSPSRDLKLSTVQARRFIQGRLESFRLLLPPKPAQYRLDLVLQIWNNIDHGRESVYWLDVVIEKEWHFLFG